MSAKVDDDYLSTSESPIVRILNYLAVTAASDELFESLLADMQTLGAIPQNYFSGARNMFDILHGSTSSDANSLNGDEVSVALLDGCDVGGENGDIQTSHDVIDYDPDKDDEGFSSPSAAVDNDITNISSLDRLEVCQEVAAADTGRSVPSRKRKQPSPEEKEEERPQERASGKRRKQCSIEGCTNWALRGGVCGRHGGAKLCSSEGCTNQAVKGGVCIRHGAKYKRCSNEGCTNQAQKGGVCYRHGAKRRPCNSDGCPKYARQGGLCIRHGAKVKLCSS